MLRFIEEKDLDQLMHNHLGPGMLLEEGRVVLQPLGVGEPCKAGDRMVVGLDISLYEMEALLENHFKEVGVAGALLSHNRGVVESKLSHCQVVVLDETGHDLVHSGLNRG